MTHDDLATDVRALALFRLPGRRGIRGRRGDREIGQTTRLLRPEREAGGARRTKADSLGSSLAGSYWPGGATGVRRGGGQTPRPTLGLQGERAGTPPKDAARAFEALFADGLVSKAVGLVAASAPF